MNKYIVDHFNYRVIGMVFENTLESDIYTLTGGENNEFVLISATSPEKALEKLKIMQDLMKDD